MFLFFIFSKLSKRYRRRVLCTNNFRTRIITKMLSKGVFGNEMLIQSEVMSIYNQGSMCLINCYEFNSLNIKHRVNFIWSHPSTKEFSFKILEPRVIEKCPISSLEHLFLDKFIMPFISFVVESQQCSRQLSNKFHPSHLIVPVSVSQVLKDPNLLQGLFRAS